MGSIFVMRSGGTVLASLTRALVDYGATKGVERARLVRAAQVPEVALAAKYGRLPQNALTSVWGELIGRLGPHGIGLDFAEHAGPGTYGVVALRDMTSDTFGDALHRHCRHHRVLKDDVSAILRETSTSSTVFLATPSGRLGYAAAMAEAALAPYALHARSWTGVDVTPEEVRFEHARPAGYDAYERLFGCPVYFDQSVTSIRFSRDVLALPLVHAQRDLCEFLETSVEQELSRLFAGDLAEVVYRAVAEQLGRGDVSVVTVARSLGLGVRTLQRRLRDEAVCFQDVVDSVRHHRALELLLDPSQCTTSISDLLGFSDPRAFRRAFARWTGVSPDRYRRLHARQVA
jgi:AraC-like DNA-binding protein